MMMKINFQCLMVLLTFVCSTPLWSTDTIHVTFDGTSFEEVLTRLESKCQIKFSYSSEQMDMEQPIFIDVVEADVSKLLKMVFAQTQVVFELIGGQVVLAIDKNKVVEKPDLGFEEKPLRLAMEPEIRYVRITAKEIPFISHKKMNTRPSSKLQNVVPQSGKSFPLDFSDVESEDEEHVIPNLHFSLFPTIGYRIRSGRSEPTNIGLHATVGIEPLLRGVAVASVGSHVSNGMVGMQVSGVMNSLGGDSHGAQISGAVNYSADDLDGVQVTGLVNVGNRVRKGQISGLINIGKRVDGFQIGLINIADTINGPAIGLLSIARNGYQSLELSYQDGITANTILRMGTKPFYNIFRLGSRVDEFTWALGYGIGSSIPLGKKNYLQMEAIASHVNENGWWTNRLNLLGQFNITANIKMGNHVALSFGPTVNFALSQLYNAETDEFGMNLGHNYFLNKTYGPRNSESHNWKGWIGWHVGLRFESK